MSDLLRGGRLSRTREDVVRFTSSAESDERILEAILKINKAHIVMMMERKIIDPNDGVKLLKALDGVRKGVRLKETIEDAHLYIEEEVAKAVGPDIGGDLHIAKSRNDQVSAAIRMRLLRDILVLISSILRVQGALLELVERYGETLVLGYTHLQPAQPVTFGHHLLAYVDMMERDLQRIEEAYGRVNLSPMGACALATTSFPISRERVAELLGFDGLIENSIDAVGSRDFVLETMGLLSVLAVDVSRIVEDMIVWSSYEFGVVELPDQFASTSSIMPQKKNPDVLEVIRARMNHILGNCFAALATVKALPSTYNLDFQEITPLLWNSVDTLNDCLRMLANLVPFLKVNKELSQRALSTFSTTTELANTLVRRYQIPFRTAHRIVGALVKKLVDNGLTVKDITPSLLRDVAHESSGLELEATEEDIASTVDPRRFVEAHRVTGGPSPAEVERMTRVRKSRKAATEKWVRERRKKLNGADAKLRSASMALSRRGTG